MDTKFIAIEGKDQIGKATQARMLADTLSRNNLITSLVEIPRKHTSTGKLLYWMLKNGSAKKYPTMFQTVQMLNRLMFQTFELFTGFSDFVIFDRWTSSAIAYGVSTGISENVIKLLNWPMLKPDLTIVITGKKLLRGEDDAYEADNELQQRVAQEYDRLVRERSDHVCVSNVHLDGKLKSRDEMHSEIVALVNNHLAQNATKDKSNE